MPSGSVATEVVSDTPSRARSAIASSANEAVRQMPETAGRACGVSPSATAMGALAMSAAAQARAQSTGAIVGPRSALQSHAATAAVTRGAVADQLDAGRGHRLDQRHT